MTGSSGHKHNLLVLVHTDQPFVRDREVLYMKLDENGLIIYQLVLFGCAQTKKNLMKDKLLASSFMDQCIGAVMKPDPS